MQSKRKTSIEEHTVHADSERRQLFLMLRNEILETYPDAVEKVMHGYIGYGLRLTRTSRLQKTFLQIEVHKQDVLLYLRPIKYREHNLLISKAPSRHQWTCDRLVRLTSAKDIPKVLKLIQQSFEDVRDK